MATAGQPTLYKPEYRGLARTYCLLGATNAELAAFLEVTRRTVDNWIARHPDFAEAAWSGRVAAAARAARCLHDRAVGWQHTVERTVMSCGKARTLTDVVRYPPTQACIFWLRNRRPEMWRERAVTSGDRSVDLMVDLDAAGERARRPRQKEASDTV